MVVGEKMGNKIRENFGFVKEVFPKLYEKLTEAEKTLYIDYRQSGKVLRECHEMLCDYLLKENHLSLNPKVGNHVSLNEKIDKLVKHKLYPVDGEAFITCMTNGGRTVDIKYRRFWVQIGNQCAHAEAKPEDIINMPKVSFKSVKDLMCVVHGALKNAFGAGAGDVDEFDENYIPIGDYHIIKSRKPIDSKITGCIRENECAKYNSFGKKKYSIIRVYKAISIDENQRTAMIRDGLTFSEVQDEKGIQFDGNVNINIISDIDDKKSGFYIVAYDFNKEPIALQDLIKKKYSNDVALELCLSIARIVKEFHSMEMPIYLRNLNYNCVYVCERNDKYEPSIINLDYAKISSDEYGTVISSVRGAQNVAKQMSLMKYTAPEVRAALMNKNANIDVDWGKADIYSLGMLFFDILGKEVADKPISAALKLQKEGYLPSVTQLVDAMRNQSANGRPTIDVVIDLLEK